MDTTVLLQEAIQIVSASKKKACLDRPDLAPRFDDAMNLMQELINEERRRAAVAAAVTVTAANAKGLLPEFTTGSEEAAVASQAIGSTDTPVAVPAGRRFDARYGTPHRHGLGQAIVEAEAVDSPAEPPLGGDWTLQTR